MKKVTRFVRKRAGVRARINEKVYTIIDVYIKSIARAREECEAKMDRDNPKYLRISRPVMLAV